MLSTFIRRFAASSATAAHPKRFYKEVTLVNTASNQPGTSADTPTFEICLDQRRLRTPSRKVLQVENEALALAIAQEWSRQPYDEPLDSSSMLLTGLAFTTQDNPLQKNKESVAAEMMSYLDSDTVFYMVDEPEKLRKLQELHWGKLLEWVRTEFNIDIKPSKDLLSGPRITPESRESLERYLLNYNFASLIGYQFASEAVKSLLVAIAVVNCRLTADEAVKIALIEQLFQAELWGALEGAHDVDYNEVCCRLSAGVLFAQLNSRLEIRRSFDKTETNWPV